MKRFLVAVALMLSLSNATFAGCGITSTSVNNTPIYAVSGEYSDNRNFNFNIDYNKMAFQLCLNNDEFELVKNVHNRFCKNMAMVAEQTNGDRKNMIFNHIDYELCNMRYVLEPIQYHNFLVIFNKLLCSNGFSDIVYEYCDER